MKGRQSISRFLWITILFFVQTTIYAQNVDSTRTVTPDSVLVADSSSVKPPDTRSLVSYSWYVTGEKNTLRRPAETSALSAVSDLANLAPGFVFDLGTPGWPHGWSTFGLSSNTSALDLDGKPFQQLVTQRPLVELLPIDWTAAPVFDTSEMVARTRILAFSENRPYTELRYLGGDDGLQMISALHQQTKRKTWFSRPGEAQYILGVAGKSVDGEYPASAADVTQILGRIRYRNQGWSLELSNLHSRSNTGAHGGVIPVLDLNSIFDRRIGQVLNSTRKRILIRNDLSATLRFRLLGESHPEMALSAYWQAERFRTEQSSDTLEAVNGTFGFVAQQQLTRNPSRHRLLISLKTALDTAPYGNAFSPSNRQRVSFRASVEDSVLLDVASFRALAAYDYLEGSGFPTGQLSGSVGNDIQFFVEASSMIRGTSWIAREGWGDLIEPALTIKPSRINLLQAGLRAELSTVTFRTGVFLSEVREPVLLLQTAALDTLEFVQDSDAIERLGISIDVGWREKSNRGFRASLQGIWLHRNPSSSQNFGMRLAEQYPEWSGHGRMGLRYLLFSGDLDLTISVGGRMWTSLRSPVFHGPTGLFSIPLAENATYGPSGYLDFDVRAVLRGATIFVAYENALSGLAYPGTFVVPLYPVAEQRFRFGVLWPIWN